jgi:hypothetical protein
VHFAFADLHAQVGHHPIDGQRKGVDGFDVASLFIEQAVGHAREGKKIVDVNAYIRALEADIVGLCGLQCRGGIVGIYVCYSFEVMEETRSVIFPARRSNCFVLSRSSEESKCNSRPAPARLWNRFASLRVSIYVPEFQKWSVLRT